MTETDKMKYAFLGYSHMAVPPWHLIKKAIESNLDTLQGITDKTMVIRGNTLCTMQDVREKVKDFYEKTFSLHDIYMIEDASCLETLANSQLDIVEGYTSYINHCKMASVFDIPIAVGDGYPMEGCLVKPVIPIPDNLIPNETGKKIPFLRIELNGRPTQSMMAMYTHELMHVLSESNPGYANDLTFKEVLPTFIEKVFIIEELESVELLQSMEKARAVYDTCCLVEAYNRKEVREDGVLHALGSLLGLKLFEKYYSGSEHTRRKYLKAIQKVIDGQMTVESLLIKDGITVSSVLQPAFIAAHL